MLPFQKNKQDSGYSMDYKHRESDEPLEDEEYEMLDAVAEDIFTAIDNRDSKLLKDALKSLIEYIEESDEQKDRELMGEYER